MNLLRLFFSFILLCSAAASLPSYANADDHASFMALSGNKAKNFELSFDLQLIKSRLFTQNGLTYERYQQYYAGAQVLGGQITVLKNTDGEIQHVIGNYYDNITPQNQHSMAPAAAAAVVNDKIGSHGKRKIDLMINPRSGDFFYRIETQRAHSRWFHWINAEDGKMMKAYDGLMHGSGTGVQGDDKDLTGLTTFSRNVYELVSTDGRQTTYDAKNRNKLPGTLATDGDDVWITPGTSSPGQAAMVDAQFYAKVTDDYYLETHLFDWLKEYPQGMVSSVHVQRRYNNAYWNGSQMAYGDGDGSSFIEFSGDLDVVGHELSHGVTEAFSNLIYQNESGALNEAFSDIMGTAIEFYYGTGNWTIGEDITIGSNGIRNMADPGEDGDPSHYDERYTGTADNGGVHINSGIINHWFYLLVNGGQNSDPNYASGSNVTGIGLAAAEDIAFMGFTALPATANFCAARDATIAIAGSHASNVTDAWNEVGVDEALCNNTSSGPGPVITNVSSQKSKGTKFIISWTTDIAADSTVTFTCCGSYHSSALVTQHSMSFNGSKGASYEYFVSSEVNGQTTTEGPFTHQN